MLVNNHFVIVIVFVNTTNVVFGILRRLWHVLILVVIHMSMLKIPLTSILSMLYLL